MAKKTPSGLPGRTIVEMRPMTPADRKAEGWDMPRWQAPPVVLVLDDGTRLYPSADEEGNRPGVLFGMDPKGGQFLVTPP